MLEILRPVKILLDAGADANLKDLSNRTPLWPAARYNHVEIVELLLPRITDIDEQIYNGPTCLATAARWGNVESVKLLLEAGAEIWSREPGPGFLPPERRLMWYGTCALGFAFDEDGCDDDTIRLILAAGANRPAVEPEFKKWLEVWDRRQPDETEKLMEWVVTTRIKPNGTKELEKLRRKMSKSIDVITDERRGKLAKEWGLPTL